jgi:hypothetical protein
VDYGELEPLRILKSSKPKPGPSQGTVTDLRPKRPSFACIFQVVVSLYTGCIKKRRPLEIMHIVKI